MDTVLEWCDTTVFDSLYEVSALSNWERGFFGRQILTLTVLLLIFGFTLYFGTSILIFYTYFDRSVLKHPLYLKNQIWMEIRLAVVNFPVLALLTAISIALEIRYAAKMYDTVELTPGGIGYIAFSLALLVVFTDFTIYWVHRALHLQFIYQRVHKQHHKFVISTPFSSYAFHFLDSYGQSIPYHVFPFLVPFNKWLFLFMFVFVNFWTISSHDHGGFIPWGGVVNNAAHHTLHHTGFHYNYGQYFNVWDRVFGTHKLEPLESSDKPKRS